MSFFGKLFRPYAEYDVETVFAEAELEAVFEKEFSPWSFFGGFRAALRENEVTFFRRDPLVLQPVLRGANSLRGVISFRCTPAEENAPGSSLHITIAPPDMKWFLGIWLSFCIVGAVVLTCLRIWQAVIPLVMAGFGFAFFAMLRAMAEREIPAIRREFEVKLREFERKYHGE